LEKIAAFLQSIKSTLPVIAVDMPGTILAQLALQSSWIADDEAWRPILTDSAMTDRKYADTIREAVRKIVKEDGHDVFWLFGVREGKVGRFYSIFEASLTRTELFVATQIANVAKRTLIGYL